jgi:hypothetical protein
MKMKKLRERIIRVNQQQVIAQQGLALLEKEYHLGKFAYRSREDIHDRASCTD